MQQSLTMGGNTLPRFLSFLSGIGMAVFSIMTIDHYYSANYPESIFEGSFCDISAFFNCDSSAYAAISAIGGVPLGYFGLVVGALVALGVVLPSLSFERTNKAISLLNAVGVVALFIYTVFFLGSLCLLCTGFYVFSLVSFFLFWKHGVDRELGFLADWFRPSVKLLATFAALGLFGAYAFTFYTDARQLAQSGGVATRAVKEFYNLEPVEWPSFISPLWTAQSTEHFEDAPIRIVEYGDLLCSDCLILYRQLNELKAEFEGKINIAFQMFPLEAQCNDVVEKDLHPGACDVSYMAAYDPDKFVAIHDEIFENLRLAKRQAEWRADLARRFDVEAALTDSATIALVDRMIQTGREYEKTHERFSYGIRSTPTMIVNNRMIIGTLPIEQLRAVFQALVDEHESGERRFIENWEE
ncbi:MAG: thioredoxin domain-containing protein [Gemmatimonadota bacterium]|nr:MAG: thioredoxin domain-containing protein [Gemmatimonadota bacterium]